MQAQVSNKEMSAGGPSESEKGNCPCQPHSDIQELNDPRLLRAVSKEHNIDSTKSLVAAYNATTDKTERAVLLGWLLKYSRRIEECLTPESVLEYSELAKIAPRSMHDKDLLRNLLRALSSCVRQGEFLRPNFAVALYRALVHVDPSVYGGVAQLVVVAKKLLSSLSPEPTLSIENYDQHETTFLALHQAFYLIHKTNQTGIHEKEKRDLRRSIAEKEKELELSCEYYPVNFHFKALRQTVERFEVREPISHIWQAMWCGLCGFLHVLHCLRNLTNCDIDPTAIVDAFRGLRQETVAFGVSKRPWFDKFRTLMVTRLEASKDEAKLAAFGSECDTAMESQRTIKGDDSKALRYGIIQEIKMLANQGSCEDVRQEATAKLIDLATNHAVGEGWNHDSDLLLALLNALHEIHVTGECKPITAEALLETVQRSQDHANETLATWLGDCTMDDKLQMQQRREEANRECEKVFTSIGRDVGYLPLATIRANVEDLKKKYLHDNFAKVNIPPILLRSNQDHVRFQGAPFI